MLIVHARPLEGAPLSLALKSLLHPFELLLQLLPGRHAPRRLLGGVVEEPHPAVAETEKASGSAGIATQLRQKSTTTSTHFFFCALACSSNAARSRSSSVISESSSLFIAAAASLACRSFFGMVACGENGRPRKTIGT